MVASTIAYIKRARAERAAEQATIEQIEQAHLDRYRKLDARLLAPLYDVIGKTRIGTRILVCSAVTETTALEVVDNWYQFGSVANMIPHHTA